MTKNHFARTGPSTENCKNWNPISCMNERDINNCIEMQKLADLRCEGNSAETIVTFDRCPKPYFYCKFDQFLLSMSLAVAIFTGSFARKVN